MTRSLAKIREQLTQLDAQTETQWHRLAQTYDQYAQRLGQTLQQQAVYAVYQICTQIYPEAFLQLSYSDRQKFQQSIRTAIADFYDQFLDALKKRGITLDLSQPLPEAEPESEDGETLIFLDGDRNDLNLGNQDPDSPPENLSSPVESPETEDADAQETEEKDDNFPSMQEIKAFLSEALEKEGLSLEMLIPKMLRLDQDQTPLKVKTPDDLVQWHRQVEKCLQRSLVSLSMHLNHNLTTRKIIPENLPPRVLEMALQAEDERLAPNREKMPHIVNLLIETAHKTLAKTDDEDTDIDEDQDQSEPDEDTEDNEEESETVRGEISRLTVINLRLTDLEFSDVNLSMIRKQIRTYLNDLKKLRQQYRQLSQQKLSAEAELAWRSSWNATETPNL
ncbi:MAG: hypothetical protein VKL20_00405 [Synechocystis sp.]|nr:hypothetical protein [Synechocystis sp.]